LDHGVYCPYIDPESVGIRLSGGRAARDLRLPGGSSWKSLALKRGEWKKLLKKTRAHTGLSADVGDEFENIWKVSVLF
jgi:hypothetical protein